MLRQAWTATLMGVLALSLVGGTALADERPPPRTITLELASQGMAEIREPFRIRVTSPGGMAGLTAVLQVRTANGFKAGQRLKLDRQGRASGSIVSKRPGERTYRVVLQSARGRFLAASAPVNLTWLPLRHSVSLECTRSVASLRVDIPCTATVSPALRLDRMIVMLQVRGRTDWVLVEASRVSGRGTATIPVTGITVGESQYRALLLRDARLLSESAVVTVAFTEPPLDPTGSRR